MSSCTRGGYVCEADAAGIRPFGSARVRARLLHAQAHTGAAGHAQRIAVPKHATITPYSQAPLSGRRRLRTSRGTLTTSRRAGVGTAEKRAMPNGVGRAMVVANARGPRQARRRAMVATNAGRVGRASERSESLVVRRCERSARSRVVCKAAEVGAWRAESRRFGEASRQRAGREWESLAGSCGAWEAGWEACGVPETTGRCLCHERRGWQNRNGAEHVATLHGSTGCREAWG